MLKKFLSFTIAAILLVSFSACSSKPVSDTSEESSEASVVSSSTTTSKSDSSKTESSKTVAESGETEASSQISTTTGNNGEESSQVAEETGSSASSTVSSVDIPDQVIYIYGGDSNENRAKLKSMGLQSWYPMYSTTTSVDITGSGNYDLSTLKECNLTVAGLWKPNETVTDADGNVCSGSWFAIRKDGFCSGDTAFTGALKWVCEYDGTYKVVISYSGGSSSGCPEEGYYEGTGESAYYVPAADGVYMSAYINNNKVFGIDTWTCSGHRADQTDLTFENQQLKAGETVVIVADSKANGGWDDPWWYVYIERVGD